MNLIGAALCVGTLSCAVAAASAQETAGPATRTILQRSDVAASPAQEVIFGTVQVSPGGGNPFHTHFGTEMGYVIQGRIRLEVRGMPSRELGPGDSFMVQRGFPHRSVPLGTAPVRLVNTWTVDKGKPILTPAP